MFKKCPVDGLRPVQCTLLISMEHVRILFFNSQYLKNLYQMVTKANLRCNLKETKNV